MKLRVGDRVQEPSGRHVSQFAVLEMRRVAKLVAKGRARWTAYGVKLRTKRGE